MMGDMTASRTKIDDAILQHALDVLCSASHPNTLIAIIAMTPVKGKPEQARLQTVTRNLHDSGQVIDFLLDAAETYNKSSVEVFHEIEPAVRQ